MIMGTNLATILLTLYLAMLQEELKRYALMIKINSLV